MVSTGSREWLRKKWLHALTQIGKNINYGTRPYQREWDVLIILDACRYDLFREFAIDHEIHENIDDIEKVYSCASSSDEWLIKSFEKADDEQVTNTCYVTANAYTHLINLDRFHEVTEVWKFARDPESGTTLPKAVTNEAIRTYRDHPGKKHVIHYFQPHAPFLHCREQYAGPNGDTDVWEGLRRGDYDGESIWEDYGRNLQEVLDHVETIRNNVSGTIAVTADHGNLMGEYGLYGHPSYVPLPQLKRVPWAKLEGTGESEYVVKSTDEISTVRTEEPSIKEHLRQLGYAE